MKTNEPSIEKIEGKKGTIYRVQIRKKGFKHQSRSFTTFKSAKKWKYDIIKAQTSGETTDTAVMRRTLLSNLIDRYIENVLDPTSTNYITRLGQLRWWREELGHCVVTHVTEDLISQSLERLYKTPDRFGKPRKDATINRYSTTLSCLLEKACKEWRLIPRNPVRNLKKRIEPKKKKRVLSLEECRKLLEICQNYPSAYVLPLISIFLCTGARRGEVLYLRQRDFSPIRGEIFLENTKNGESRTVPLVEPALGYLKDYVSSLPEGGVDDYLFPGRTKLKPIDIRGTWKIVLRQAGIEDLTLHSLRHTAISLLSELKIPVHIIAQIVGHKTLAMTMHYTNPSSEFIRDSLKNLGEKININCLYQE